LRPGEAALEDRFEGDLEEDLVGDFVGEDALEVLSSSGEVCAFDDFLVEKRFFIFLRDLKVRAHWTAAAWLTGLFFLRPWWVFKLSRL
jgi:hypothetical protein